MLVERLPNRSPVFAGRWDVFAEEWRKAAPSAKTVLPDGRPAVRHEGEPPSYITVHPHVWEIVKPRLKQMFAGGAAPKRVRLCEACGQPLKVVQEQETVWIFRCEACGSREIQAKARIGGTQGAGDKEKR